MTTKPTAIEVATVAAPLIGGGMREDVAITKALRLIADAQAAIDNWPAFQSGSDLSLEQVRSEFRKKATQFKAGTSRNPTGKPKEQAEMNSTPPVQRDGVEKNKQSTAGKPAGESIEDRSIRAYFIEGQFPEPSPYREQFERLWREALAYPTRPIFQPWLVERALSCRKGKLTTKVANATAGRRRKKHVK